MRERATLGVGEGAPSRVGRRNGGRRAIISLRVREARFERNDNRLFTISFI